MARRLRLAIALATGLVAITALPAGAGPSARTASTTANDVIEKAASYLGGVAELQAIEAFGIDASGNRWTLDEGFSPGVGAGDEGTFTQSMVYSVALDSLKIDYEISSFGFDRVVSEVVNEDLGYIDGQFFNGAPPGTVPMLTDRLMSIRQHQRLLNPHLLLIEALSDPNAVIHLKDRANGDHILRFADGTTPIRMVVDGTTGRVKKLATSESDPLRRDTRLRVRYRQWHDAGGVKFPGMVKIRYSGELIHLEQRGNISINPTVDPATFEIPAGVNPAYDPVLAERGDLSHQYIQSFAALGFPRDGFQPFVDATELAKGVWWVTGGTHHSLAVVRDDDIVIVEGNLDEVRTDAVLAWLDASFPGMPVSYAVQSHHHADHSAGLRQYAAGGAGIVVHEAAADFFAGVMAARSRIVPDDLAAPGAPTPEIVAVPADIAATVIEGSIPVAIYPFPTEHAEDFVLVEAGGILFVVDIFSPGFGPLPPVVDEIIAFVEMNEIDVDWVAGGHGSIVSWSELVGTRG